IPAFHFVTAYKPRLKVWVPLLNRELAYADGVLIPNNAYANNFLQFIDHSGERFKGKRVLEIGTGSGVLAIALARAGAQVDASDISDESLTVAEENIRGEPPEVQARIRLKKSDVYQGLSPEDIADGYDYVIFNHPLFSFRPTSSK